MSPLLRPRSPAMRAVSPTALRIPSSIALRSSSSVTSVLQTSPPVPPVPASTQLSVAEMFRTYQAANKGGGSRQSYPREFKIMAIKRYREICNKSAVARELNIAPKRLREWLKHEARILEYNKGQRKGTAGRKAELPDMEKLLYQSFLEVREKGFRISCMWFFEKAKKLYEALYPDQVTKDDTTGLKVYGFGFSVGWFVGFKRRFNISLRCITNKAQSIPALSARPIRNFHHFIRKNAQQRIRASYIDSSDLDGNQQKFEEICDVGRYRLCNIANMDQTPIPFENLCGRTYETSGSTTVWAKSQGSGLEKRQATAQLTITADGIKRHKAVLVFHGTGQRLSKKERDEWDPRVRVYFQKQAWVDEDIFCNWLYNDWGTAEGGEPRMLVLDVHRPHRTDRALSIMRRYNTLPAFVPPGCTSLVQPLDVAVNKIFKDLVDSEFQKHYAANLDEWTHGHLTASQRRVLMTKWIAEAWDQLHTRYKDLIVNSFRKLGISLPLDGSCDSEIHIKGLEGYVVGDWWENPAMFPDGKLPSDEDREIEDVTSLENLSSAARKKHAADLKSLQAYRDLCCLAEVDTESAAQVIATEIGGIDSRLNETLLETGEIEITESIGHEQETRTAGLNGSGICIDEDQEFDAEMGEANDWGIHEAARGEWDEPVPAIREEDQTALFDKLTQNIPRESAWGPYPGSGLSYRSTLKDLEFVSQPEAEASALKWLEDSQVVHDRLDALPASIRKEIQPYEVIPTAPDFW